MDMDIGKLLSDQEKCKQLSEMGPIADVHTAREKLKHINELRIESREKIDIIFQ